MENENQKAWEEAVQVANAVLFDEDGRPVAAARWAKVAPDTAYVSYVEVRLDSRRQGWGRRLWEAIIEKAGERVVKFVGEQKNEAAVRLRSSVFPNTAFFLRGEPVGPEEAAQFARQTDRTFAVSFLYGER